MNDAGICNKSLLRKKIESDEIYIPEPRPLPFGSTGVPYVFVGNDAFELKTYMMKPYIQRYVFEKEKCCTECRVGMQTNSTTQQDDFSFCCIDVETCCIVMQDHATWVANGCNI